MAKIYFTHTPYREGIQLIYEGCKMICKETARLINNAVHRWPYAFMLAEAAILFILSFASIGQARAERDHAAKQAYKNEQRADSLALTGELWHDLLKKHESGSN